jgi:hypothetical protein
MIHLASDKQEWASSPFTDNTRREARAAPRIPEQACGAVDIRGKIAE